MFPNAASVLCTRISNTINMDGNVCHIHELVVFLSSPIAAQQDPFLTIISRILLPFFAGTPIGQP